MCGVGVLVIAVAGGAEGDVAANVIAECVECLEFGGVCCGRLECPHHFSSFLFFSLETAPSTLVAIVASWVTRRK